MFKKLSKITAKVKNKLIFKKIKLFIYIFYNKKATLA